MTDDQDNEIDVILGLLNGKSRVRILAGRMVSAATAAFTVDVGGGRIPAVPLTSYLPEINENVWVAFIDDLVGVLGPTTAKPGKGVVVSVASNLVTLTTAFGPVTVPYPSGATPTAGQTWKLMWQGGGFAVAVMSVDPAAQTAPSAPGGGSTTTHVDTFTAIDAGSYQSGKWWTPEVWATDSNLGAWFNGTKISDTIPASAAIAKVEIFISANKIYGFAPNFALHGYQSRPAGSPTLGATTAVGIGAGGWVTLPSSYGDALKAGGGSYGVGVSHGGDNRFKSLAQDGLSGALRITSVY